MQRKDLLKRNPPGMFFFNGKKATSICHVGPYQPWAESGFYSKRQSLQKCTQKGTDLRRTGVEVGRLV